MIGRLHHLIIDCPDPLALAAFYAELLGQPITYRSDDFVVVSRNGTTSGLAFQLAPGHQPPAWPDPARPQQMHLDVMVEDVAAAGPRVLALGAVKLDGDGVYADPAGHPFCLIPRPGWAAPIPDEAIGELTARPRGYRGGMNWTWNIRSNDGAMNGLEFARCTTAGGFGRVLIHAAPAHAKIEVIDGDDRVLARADLERSGEYSPMTLIELDGGAMRRSEVWPDKDMYGLPVLLAGGEAGILRSWWHAEDRSWWRWSIDFSNHVGRPDDWAPPTGT